MKTLIPSAAYTSQIVAEEEYSCIFHQGWQFAGFARDLANDNDYFTVEIAGKSVVVQRFGDAVKAFTNVCSHRHCAIRCEQYGNGPLRCAYHGWQYNEDGVPHVIPHKPRFEGLTLDLRRQLGLEKWNVEFCGEFIFVRKSDGESLKTDLAHVYNILEEISNAMGALLYRGVDEVQANWKVVVENSLEAYHVGFLHQDTFASLGMTEASMDVSTRHTTWDANWNDDHTRNSGRVNNRIYPERPLKTNGYRHILVFPNTMIATSFGTSFAVHRVNPNGPESSWYESYFFSTKSGAPNSATDARMRSLMEERLVSFNRKVFAEDRSILASVQRGLKNASKCGLLSEEELRICRFQNDYLSVMAGA